MTISVYGFANQYLNDINKYRVLKRFIHNNYIELYESNLITEEEVIIDPEKFLRVYNKKKKQALSPFLRLHFSNEEYKRFYSKVYANRHYYEELGLISLKQESKNFYLVEKPRELISEIKRNNYNCIIDFYNNNNISLSYSGTTRKILENQKMLIEKRIIKVDKKKVVNVIDDKALKSFVESRTNLIKVVDQRTNNNLYLMPALTFLRTELGLSQTKAINTRKKMKSSMLKKGILVQRNRNNGLLLVKKPALFKKAVLEFINKNKEKPLSPRTLFRNDPRIEKPISLYTQFCVSKNVRQHFEGWEIVENDKGRKSYIINDRLKFIECLNKYIKYKAH